MGNYKLISVESRKGGVGKTTAALNLGFLLRNDYHVLILDIDITGTSIRAIHNSRFWRNDAYLLEDVEGKTMNLLQYFTQTYLKGKNLLEFTSSDVDGKITVKDNTINVIASELYGEEAELLYDPSLLLENIHVFWLTEMIEKICVGFSDCFSDTKPSVIILDNSPGFVGIGKAVHDMLTDKGPVEGKFLTVSSLDMQDLESCLKAIYSIQGDYQRKYHSVIDPEKAADNGDFYAQVKLSGDTEYTYYKNIKKEETLSSYQGLLINKVAKEIVEGVSYYDFQSLLTPQIAPIYAELANDGIQTCMVPFDSVLLTQFYGAILSKEKKQKTSFTTLNARLATIDGQLRMLEDLGVEDLPLDLLRKASGLDKTIDTLKGALIASDYDVMASKFNHKWSPVWPLQKLLEVLKKQDFAASSKELYFPKRARMEKEMDLFVPIIDRLHRYAEQRQEFAWFGGSVASIACEMSFCYSNTGVWIGSKPWPDDAILDETKEAWVSRTSDSLCMWMDSVVDGYITSNGNYFASYLLGNDATQYDDLLAEIINNVDFIKAFKQSVSRLMDIVPDIKTLVNLIRTVTVYNEGSYSKDVDFVPFLNHKIVTKEYDYAMAKEAMLTELRDSDYMDSYRHVLSRVLHKWGF